MHELNQIPVMPSDLKHADISKIKGVLFRINMSKAIEKLKKIPIFNKVICLYNLYIDTVWYAVLMLRHPLVMVLLQYRSVLDKPGMSKFAWYVLKPEHYFHFSKDEYLSIYSMPNY